METAVRWRVAVARTTRRVPRILGCVQGVVRRDCKGLDVIEVWGKLTVAHVMTHTQTHKHTHMLAHTHTHTHTHPHPHTNTLALTHIHAYTHKHTHTHRPRARAHTHTHTHWHTTRTHTEKYTQSFTRLCHYCWMMDYYDLSENMTDYQVKTLRLNRRPKAYRSVWLLLLTCKAMTFYRVFYHSIHLFLFLFITG